MNMGDVGVEPDFLGSDGRCRLGFARQDKRAITLASKGVLVSGRYGHGKPRKPVNPPLSVNGKEKKDCLRSPFTWMLLL